MKSRRLRPPRFPPNAVQIDKSERLWQLLREMARPFAEVDPSSVRRVPWIFADRKVGHYPSDTDRSGKWLVFVDVEQLDATWKAIKAATEQGLLGSHTKCATALQNPNATNQRTKVICVYTYDWQDEADVRRVRAELRRLGIEKKISYKADEDTLAGRYQVTGSKKIAKYYE